MHGNDPLEGLGQKLIGWQGRSHRNCRAFVIRLALRLLRRWVCPLADSAPFKETTYGVRLKAHWLATEPRFLALRVCTRSGILQSPARPGPGVSSARLPLAPVEREAKMNN